MQALYFPKYGNYEVLKVNNIEMPMVEDGEYLVKVNSSSLTTAESMMRRANPLLVRFVLGLFKPKHNISGACFSGTVIQDDQNKLKPNQQFPIFGEVGENLGANADYIKVKKNGAIMRKPDDLSFEEAACICDGTITSYYFLSNLINTKAGESILINGATGSLGLAAIQIAKSKGLKITAICSEKNFELVKSLGAGRVFSYKTKNYLDKLSGFDYIFDCVGKIPYKILPKILNNDGHYMSPVISRKIITRQLLNGFHRQKVKFAAVGMLPKDQIKDLLVELIQLKKSGSMIIPINRTFSFENVIEAHKIIDSGHKTGNFILKHK